ncbi:SCO6880 family protein [Spirillospora sp. NPDC029432]|uniref:SCO6880 family protein n=1 Tax=Spirillospora sp. NPDC029432 TaxID=3154599 RepID=UPI0034557086
MARSSSVRTYGNWRKPVSPGIGRLGMLGTMILLIGLVVTSLAMMISLVAGLVVAVTLGVVLLPLLVQDRHGRTALQAATARIAWWRGKSKGWHLYRSGPLGIAAHGSFRLPGLLAPSRLITAQDSYGRPFGMVVMPQAGHYTAVLECGADGAALVDQDQIDTWVAHWGQWLAALAFEPGLVAASVTIETAPDLGHRLQREITANLYPDAPEMARQALREIIATYPAGSAQVSTRIAVTYSAAPRPGAKKRTLEEMAREIGTRLPGLSSGLAMTGAGTARPMTAPQIAASVRVAYDPESQATISTAAGDEPSWNDAGPSAAQEAWDHYRHDSGYSITWGMSEAPRGEVLSNVLNGLVAPHRDIARKRVTLLYRPHDPGTAARLVERDRKDARFRITGANAAARDAVAVAAADQSAREEAKGAGIVRFGMLVTATVHSSEELKTAAAAMDTLAPPARVQLRRVYGAQAAAFAAALPLGVVLPSHLQVPSIVRESL